MFGDKKVVPGVEEEVEVDDPPFVVGSVEFKKYFVVG